MSSCSGLLPPACNRQVVEHCVAAEWAVNLEDVMVRRTSWHYYHRDADRLAARVADWMAELLGWTTDTRNQQLERYLRLRTDKAGGSVLEKA